MVPEGVAQITILSDGKPQGYKGRKKARNGELKDKIADHKIRRVDAL